MFSASYYNLQETASQAVLRLPDLVRAAGGDNPPAFGTTARPHVNDIVGVSDDIQVMLDDYDRAPWSIRLWNTFRSVWTSDE